METVVSLDKAKEILDSGIEQATALIQNKTELDDLLTKVQTKIQETPVLGSAAADFPVMLQMVKSYATKEYTDVSPKVVAALVSAFLYLVKRKDLISDSIPILGQLDDLAVIAVALKVSEPELKEFQRWKASRETA